MFTGIVEELGEVKKIEHKKNLSVLHVRAKKVMRGTKKAAVIHGSHGNSGRLVIHQTG